MRPAKKSMVKYVIVMFCFNALALLPLAGLVLHEDARLYVVPVLFVVVVGNLLLAKYWQPPADKYAASIMSRSGTIVGSILAILSPLHLLLALTQGLSPLLGIVMFAGQLIVGLGALRFSRLGRLPT